MQLHQGPLHHDISRDALHADPVSDSLSPDEPRSSYKQLGSDKRSDSYRRSDSYSQLGSGTAAVTPPRPSSGTYAPTAGCSLVDVVLVGIGLLAHTRNLGVVHILEALHEARHEAGDPVKSILVLVDAARPANGPSGHRTVVEEQRALLRTASEDRGVANRLVFLDGPLSAAASTGLVSRADVFVRPLVLGGQSVTGGLSFAMAAGSTTVSTHWISRDGVVEREPKFVAQALVEMVELTRSRTASAVKRKLSREHRRPIA